MSTLVKKYFAFRAIVEDKDASNMGEYVTIGAIVIIGVLGALELFSGAVSRTLSNLASALN